MPYKCLVVAPANPDLEYASDEVMAVVNALDAQLLQGKRATIHGLVDILSESWEITWFCTHGDERGVYLTDGIVGTSELTTLIRSSNTRLTVLNTCSSFLVAHAIYDELNTSLVCTIKPVPDREAFVTGTIFARQLARGLDFYSAYLQAKPGQNSTYVFLGVRGPTMPLMYGPPSKESDADPMQRLQNIVEQLDAIVNGSQRYHITGLVKSNETLGTKLDAMAKELENVKVNQRINRRLGIINATICSLLLIAVIALWYMQGGIR